MGNASFRVVLTGDIANGHSREAAIAAMSRLCRCSTAEIARAIDAGNMLKPMLARGELHCIGATTLDEYRKYVEKDAAPARRFQPLVI